MSSDRPTFSEVGEENIRSYLKRQQRKQHEEEYDEIPMPKVL
jgi:hypothetical protein